MNYCPIAKDECIEQACRWWSCLNEECSVLLLGEGMKEISFATDDINFDCGFRVHVVKEEVAKID